MGLTQLCTCSLDTSSTVSINHYLSHTAAIALVQNSPRAEQPYSGPANCTTPKRPLTSHSGSTLFSASACPGARPAGDGGQKGLTCSNVCASMRVWWAQRRGLLLVQHPMLARAPGMHDGAEGEEIWNL